MIPAFIRLGFHGCIGRCDGCINKNLAENRGLEEVVNKLEPLNSNWVGSRADLWAIAAEVAMFQGHIINNERCATKYPDKTSVQYLTCRTKNFRKFPTEVGRIDCENGPFYDENTNLPDLNFDSAKLTEWFWKEFRKTTTQLVSLMGGHSLGRTNTKGINRAWEEDNQDGLGRRYFQNLLNLGFDREWTLKSNADGSQFFWEGRNNSFALPCDMALVKDFNKGRNKKIVTVYNPQTGHVDQPFSKLGKAKDDLFGMTRRYANDIAAWHVTFPRHMRDVLRNGYALYSPRN